MTIDRHVVLNAQPVVLAMSVIAATTLEANDRIRDAKDIVLAVIIGRVRPIADG